MKDILIFMTLMLMVAGCSSTKNPVSASSDMLQYTLSTSKVTYIAHDTLQFALTVHNAGSSTDTVAFGDAILCTWSLRKCFWRRDVLGRKPHGEFDRSTSCSFWRIKSNRHMDAQLNRLSWEIPPHRFVHVRCRLWQSHRFCGFKCAINVKASGNFTEFTSCCAHWKNMDVWDDFFLMDVMIMFAESMEEKQ